MKLFVEKKHIQIVGKKKDYKCSLAKNAIIQLLEDLIYEASRGTREIKFDLRGRSRKLFNAIFKVNFKECEA